MKISGLEIIAEANEKNEKNFTEAIALLADLVKALDSREPAQIEFETGMVRAFLATKPQFDKGEISLSP